MLLLPDGSGILSLLLVHTHTVEVLRLSDPIVESEDDVLEHGGEIMVANMIIIACCMA